ncbi:MAG: translation initiation factor eIF-2B [Candidatus Dojkabacteria bacterium]|nr:translation initiation factor eIF-2B [Candidatus Dojkabacteria bacterium]
MDEIGRIEKDIKDLKIQGATNVCISTFEGMKIYISRSTVTDREIFLKEFFEIGDRLADARDNEPLARNGVHYVKHFFKEKYNQITEISTIKELLNELCEEYLNLLSSWKKDAVYKSAKLLSNLDKILTHCHSSTVVELLKKLSVSDKDFEVVCTETRPLNQGRITAKSLVDAGIKTTMIADSAAESFAINRGSVNIDAVFLGCDQIAKGGYVINKIGSWGIAMAAYYGGKPVYIVTPLLKFDKDSLYNEIKIEVRADKELWSDAPDGLDMYNPAFEVVDNSLIAGFVTEFGIIKPSDVEDVVKRNYPWLFTD